MAESDREKTNLVSVHLVTRLLSCSYVTLSCSVLIMKKK